MTPEEVRKLPAEEVPFHGGYRPQNSLDEGFQPEGDQPLPSSVPKLTSAVVPPASAAGSTGAVPQLRMDTSSKDE